MKVAFFVCCLLAVAAARHFRVFESVEHIPKGWKLVNNRFTGEERIEFTVGLYSRNMDVLERELLKVSNPRDVENYGKWWTAQQIRDLVSPPLKEQMAVQNWLESYGMTVARYGDFQKVEGPLFAVEKLLNTKFFTFENVNTGKIKIRVLDYTVPAELDDIVTQISGLTGFPLPRKEPHTKIAADDTNGKVVPEVIWHVYNMTFPQEIVYPNSSLCLVEYENDRSYTASDLSTFEQGTLLSDISPNHIVGPYYAKFPDTEATLDVQYGIGVGLNRDYWYWTSTGWLYDWTTQFLATSPVPYVVSMSWGWTETDQCSVGNCNGMTSQQYVNTVNGQYMQITMMGVTILAASGDQGAPGDGNAKCTNSQDPLSSIFPGASQWILSIGATTLTDPSPKDPPYTFQSPFCQTTDCSTSVTERVCTYPNDLITTGGGFSTFLPQPSYQTSVVNKYLNSGVSLPPSRDYNSANRGFPDVSGLGHNFLITYFGLNTLVDGTSASTPLWAGIIARWNDYRLSNGKSPIGFANPMIYQMYQDQPSAFTDITEGNNSCTESCCVLGFTCTTGWDPVTGLGTPVYPLMWNYITKLP